MLSAQARGRLGCTSCHDPHQAPTPEEKTSYFREQCLACHEQKGCKLPDKLRLAQGREDNCIRCHMPMSASVYIVHTATIDHRILRKPGLKCRTEPDRLPSELPLSLVE